MSNSKFPEKIEEGDESKAPIDKLFDTKRPLPWPFRLLPEARDIMWKWWESVRDIPERDRRKTVFQCP